MKLITLDFETYYSKDYSLSKMTTEEYIRDPRFEAIMVGAQIDAEDPCFAWGVANIRRLLDSLAIEDNAVLCHHAHFDGLILNHHFGKRPRAWLDTLSMARAIHGIEVSGSLKKLALHYQIGEKGDEVLNAIDKHTSDFTPQEARAYSRYCMNDVRLTYDLLKRMVVGFPAKELRIIDRIVRMFTEPQLLLDEAGLRDYVLTIQAEKSTLLFEAGVTLDEVMSNEKFAAALRRLDIDPPMKTSPTTGKPAYAFAKTDQQLMELAEHPDERVQTLVAARLGNKTTINETRAERMAGMASRGPACVYYKFSGAAQTHRLSGGDSLNWQNLPRGGTLRDCIAAPDGKLLVVSDSSNIEARVLDWLAMQEDAIEVYRDYDAGSGPDVYCVMASRLYGKEIRPTDKPERQLGKTVKLACGYQMGAERFRETARLMGGLTIDLRTAAVAVEVYRSSHGMVKVLWNRAQNALGSLLSGPDEDKYLDPRGVVRIEQGALLLPNGLRIRYPHLRHERDGNGWLFESSRGKRTNIYGGKVVENVVQALARIIVMEQTLMIAKYYDVRMSTHDEAVLCVDESEVERAKKLALEVMSTPLTWCKDIPLSAKVGVGKRYGEAK